MIATGEGLELDEALAEVMPRLLALTVERPATYKVPPALMAEVLAAVPRLLADRERLREEGGEAIAADLALLPVLLCAFARAQHRHLWAPPFQTLDLGKVLPRANKAFDRLEEVVEILVRRGLVARAEVPRKTARTLRERCQHILHLHEIVWRAWPRLHEDVLMSRSQLHAAHQLACKLMAVDPNAVGPSRTEVRDRAFTLLRDVWTRLRAALDAGEREPISGVFELAPSSADATSADATSANDSSANPAAEKRAA